MKRYLAVFANKRMLTTLLLGFSCGIPFALTGSTLQAWLSVEKIDIATIGQFALIGLPYAMKFLWAPIFDRKILPTLGLRRGWMIVCQIGLFFATLALAYCNPTSAIGVFSLVALMVAFFSASQDIVVDAYRTEIIEDDAELGAAASTYISGYRIATIVSGGLALVLKDLTSWTTVYMAMAAINLVGLATILMSPEPNASKLKKSVSFRDSFALPFLEFFQRHGAMEILLFIIFYKLSTLMATALTTKFMVSLGYSLTMIGTTNKFWGLIASILGTLSGGALMVKLGLKRALWVFGIVQALAGLTFCVLAQVAVGDPSHIKNFWAIIIISMDNFMMGLGTAALAGFMMHVCNKQFTATQYALLSSVMAVGRVILIAHAGTLVEWLGWNLFFISTVPLSIPGLLMLKRYDHWETSSTPSTMSGLSKFDFGLAAVLVLSLICLSSDPLWKFLAMKEIGLRVAQIGASGVISVAALGLARPYLSKTPGTTS